LRELEGRVALVRGVTRHAGIGAAIARELPLAGARLFVTFFREYDLTRPWGLAPGEPESLLRDLGTLSEASGLDLDLSDASAPEQPDGPAR